MCLRVIKILPTHSVIVESTLTARLCVLRVQEKRTIHLYSVNGQHLSREMIDSSITDMIISDDHIIFGNMRGVIVIKELNGYVMHLMFSSVCSPPLPAHVAQWSTHSGAMCNGAWRSSEPGSKLGPGTSAFHQRIISNNYYARDEQGDNSGQEKEGSMVSSSL